MSFKFPKQFADALTPAGKAVLTAKEPVHSGFKFKVPGSSPGVNVEGMVDLKFLDSVKAALNAELRGRLAPDKHIDIGSYYDARAKNLNIDSSSRWYNYSDANDSTSKKANAYFRESGYHDFMVSDSFFEWLEKLSGLDVYADGTSGSQINYYEPGDYMAMHTDFFKQGAILGGRSPLPAMCFNLHMHMWENAAHQYVLHQGPDGHMNVMDNTCEKPGSITVYQLPFHHQVLPFTPADPSKPSYRWLMMGEAYIDADQVKTILRDYPDYWQVKSMTAHIHPTKLKELLKV